MAKFRIVIDSIMGGISGSIFVGRDDQYSLAVGIDPNQPANSFTDTGVLMPTSFVDFSSTELSTSAYPMWFLTPPLGTELLFAYINDGEILSYNTSFASETSIGTLTGGAGNGAASYNDYLYFAENADVSRYGRLSSSPTLTENVWTGATLGSQTALTDTTYPSIESVEMPNHPMHVHVDNKLYFGDFASGQGLIHYIKTTDTGTNDGSTYNALDLPFGYMPVDIESWGNDLAILAIPNTANATFRGGRAALFFWDTFSDTFYKQINLSDPGASALLNHNGVLYVWSGSYTLGSRISVYTGGNQLQQIAFIPYAEMSMAGGVDGLGNRVYFGTRVTAPETASGIMAIGYKSFDIPALNHVGVGDGGGTAMVPSIGRIKQDAFLDTDLVFGWGTGSNAGIDRYNADNANAAAWRSKVYNIGQPFKVDRVLINLGKAVAANHTLVPRLMEAVDMNNSSSSSDTGTMTSLTTINSTNFPNSERHISLRPTFHGTNNLLLELRWSGTAQLPVILPIIIEGETLEPVSE